MNLLLDIGLCIIVGLIGFYHSLKDAVVPVGLSLIVFGVVFAAGIPHDNTALKLVVSFLALAYALGAFAALFVSPTKEQEQETNS